MFWASWNRWVATEILIDKSFPLSNQWSPLCWVPPFVEEIYVEFGLGWATFLGVRVAMVWQPDKDRSSIGECPWPMCPWYNQWIPFPCNQGLYILVSMFFLSLRCLIMVENKAEGGPHWTLGERKGRKGGRLSSKSMSPIALVMV